MELFHKAIKMHPGFEDVSTISFPLVFRELEIGSRAQHSPIRAGAHPANRAFGILIQFHDLELHCQAIEKKQFVPEYLSDIRQILQRLHGLQCAEYSGCAAHNRKFFRSSRLRSEKTLVSSSDS